MPKHPEECTSQFPTAQSEVFKSYFLPNQQSKTQKTQKMQISDIFCLENIWNNTDRSWE